MDSLQPDDIIQGRYRIVRKIGQGGFGAVYEAIDLRLNSRAALKHLLLEGEQVVRAFRREAELLAGLRSAALPRVIDFFTDDRGQFLVMDYIDGDDLAVALAQRGTPYPLDEVLHWADRLLGTLSYLHTRTPPIFHRDIKPQNLKVLPPDEIVLLDFGLAKGSLETSDGTSMMLSIHAYTPGYAPPEQIDGSGTDARSDLYALAATLYHLLSGVVPPDALSRVTAMPRRQPDPLRPLHEVNPAIPLGISDVLMSAMSLFADDRPPSAAAMRVALRDADRNMVAAVPPPAAEQPAPQNLSEPTDSAVEQPPSPTEFKPTAPAAEPAASSTVVEPVASIAEQPTPTEIEPISSVVEPPSLPTVIEQSEVTAIQPSLPTVIGQPESAGGQTVLPTVVDPTGGQTVLPSEAEQSFAAQTVLPPEAEPFSSTELELPALTELEPVGPTTVARTTVDVQDEPDAPVPPSESYNNEVMIVQQQVPASGYERANTIIEPDVPARSRSRTGLWIGLVGGAIVVALIVALVVSIPALRGEVGTASQPNGDGSTVNDGVAANLDAVQTFADLSQDHTDDAVSYDPIPPVGGAHNPVWQNCGIYDEPVPNEHAVHSMEHGAVWITYDPALSAADVETLRGLVRGHRYALLSPYPGIPSPVVASAWGVQLRMTSADDPRLALFIETYENASQTPEPGASCRGGIGEPIE